MSSDRHILVIEDDYDLLFLIRKLLEARGFHVITALNGKEGKKKYRKYSSEIQSVVLDLTLPDLDGRKICRYLRKSSPDLPIIITTGSEDLEQKQDLDKIGIQAFLKKPFDLNELVDCITSFH